MFISFFKKKTKHNKAKHNQEVKFFYMLTVKICVPSFLFLP